MLDESSPQTSPCIRCAKLDGFPCMVEAKADAHVCAACGRRSATDERHAAHQREVERLETDERGKTVTVVVVDRDGVPERYRATRRRLLRRRQLRGAPSALGERAHPKVSQTRPASSAATSWRTPTPRLSPSRKEPNPTRFQKTLGVNDFYRRLRRLGLPARPHPDARQVGPRDHKGGRAAAGARLRARLHRRPRGRLLAHLGGPAEPRQPRHRRPPGADPRRVHRLEPRGAQAPDREAEGPADAARLPPDPDPEPVDPRRAHPARRRRASVRHRPLRRPSRDVGARPRVQGARPRQPVRRRHELLPVVQRRQPGADRDGERAPRRRPPDRTARRSRARAEEVLV